MARKSIIIIDFHFHILFVFTTFSQNSLTTFFNQRIEQRILKAKMKNNHVRTCKKQALLTVFSLEEEQLVFRVRTKRGGSIPLVIEMLLPSYACM